MLFRSCRPINLIFLILLIFLVIVLLYGQNTPKKIPTPELVPNVTIFNTWNACMQDKIVNVTDYEVFWVEFQEWTDECDQLAEIEKLHLVPLQNSDETKFGLLPVEDAFVGSSNNLVTLGIGKDIDAELVYKEKMKEIGRNITFYGADPITEINADLYSMIGKYFPFAVGGDAGFSSASVYVNGSYVKREVVYVDLIYFFERILKIKIIDNIWLDAEGAEYSLFDIFFKTGRLERKGIKFCQMSLEVHQPSEAKQSQFMEFIKVLIREKRFGTHKNRNVGHMRMYLFNYADSYCVKKFLGKKLYQFVEKRKQSMDEKLIT